MAKNTANLYQLNDSAFAVIGDAGLTNFGIVKGDDGAALLIDGDIRRMDEIDDALQRTGCRAVRYLLNTHENFDHSSANQYFEKNGAVVIGSDGCWEALKEDGEAKFAEMAGRSPELWTRYPDLKMGQVQVTFAQSLTLHLPGIEVRVLFAAHNGMSHSRGDAIAMLDKGRILFADDLLYTGFHPVTVYGDIPNWIRSIDHLLGQRFDYVVPGHGPVSQGEDGYKRAFEKFRDYLADFHGRLLEAKAGKKSAEEIAAYMTIGAYANMGKTWMVKRNIEYSLKDGK
jgi:cyclase